MTAPPDLFLRATQAGNGGAGFHRGTSEQDVQTPRELLSPIEDRFGSIQFDLAASGPNVCPRFYTPNDDALTCSWSDNVRGLAWLNPPYSNIAPWAEKCATEMRKGARILLLVPASVGANWFVEHVAPNAHVIELVGRVTFVGHKQPFPKDLVIAVFYGSVTGRSSWRWKDGWRR